MENEKGRWITTKTKKHVFIPEGRDVGEVLEETFSKYEDEEKFDKEEVSLEAYGITHMLKEKSSTLTQEQSNYLNDVFEKAPDDCKKILLSIKNKDFQFIVTGNDGIDEDGQRKGSYYNRAIHRCCVEKQFLQKFDDSKSSYFNGEVECHEIGHMVDNLLNDGKWGYMSSTYKSKVNGMSLHDTIKKERRKFSESIISNIAYETVRDYKQREIDALGKETVQQWDMIKRLTPEQLGVNSKDFNDDWMAYHAKIDEMRNKKFKEKYPDNDYFEFSKKINRARSVGENKFIHDHTVLSDIASSKWFETGSYGSKNHGFGLGHTEYYYQQRPDSGLGAEFFANCFAAKCTNHDEIIKTTEKYFPQSVAIFKEIMEEMKK